MGARRDADAAIGRLVDDLRARGRFDRALLIVTADHGFDAIAPTSERPHPVVVLADRFREAGIATVHVAADGGVAHRDVIHIIDLVKRSGVHKFAINVDPNMTGK